MYEVRTTDAFDAWLDSLVDRRVTRRISARVRNMRDGNFGDWKAVGGRVLESRIHYGPGYRLYFTREGGTLFVLLLGGGKSTQSRDILQAQTLAAALAVQGECNDRQ